MRASSPQTDALSGPTIFYSLTVQHPYPPHNNPQ